MLSGSITLWNRSWIRPLVIGILNAAVLLLVGCGSDTTEETVKVDPQSVKDQALGSKLTAEERDLLARAKGREWETMGIHDIEAYLTPQKDSTSAIFLWDPKTGVEQLVEIQKSVLGMDTLGVRVAIAVVEGGNQRNELVALRESQIVLPAFRIPRTGDYGFISGGLPRDNSLIVSQAGGDGATPFSNKTPIQAIRPLLTAQAPRN